MPGQHPLARLRQLSGETQSSYAQLISETYATLGLGRIQATREKVNRWENWKVTPTYKTQLAIAYVHHIPEEVLGKVAWPLWLYRGKPAAREDHRDRLAGGSAASNRASAGETMPPTGISFAGPRLASFLGSTLAQAGPAPAAHGGTPVTPVAISVLEASCSSLRQQSFHLPPLSHYRVAQAEYHALRQLTDYGSYDRSVGARLYYCVASAAEQCARLAIGLGDTERAEHFTLNSVRFASGSGSKLMTERSLDALCCLHLAAGDPRDVLTITAAASATTASPHNEVVLTIHEARAQARMRNVLASLRLVEQATVIMNTRASFVDEHYAAVNETWLHAAASSVLFDARFPRQALERYETHCESRTDSNYQPLPIVEMRCLLKVAEAHFAVGNVEAAVSAVREALSISATPVRRVVEKSRNILQRYAHLDPVRAAVEFLPTVPGQRNAATDEFYGHPPVDNPAAVRRTGPTQQSPETPTGRPGELAEFFEGRRTES
ncbi:hypothetical protein [Kitasatospora sp. LaBMicrA B282]|uniref:hypothetical protein n=1 Tax=Kitasatospora sp. LaBMicrA B282 TaxID=3420949 RepID=UPI003D0C7C83